MTDKVLFLDLDNTLLCTYAGPIPEDIAKNLDEEYQYVLDFGTEKMFGVFRPHLRTFLRFCDDYFDKMIVYTAGTDEYGLMIADLLEKFADVKFYKVYGRSSNLNIDSGPWRTGETYRKPLKLITEKDGFDIRKVLLVDDKFYNFRFNPRNGIHIPEFEPRTFLEYQEDTALLQLRDWFNMDSTRYALDFRTLNKDFIFGEYLIIDCF